MELFGEIVEDPGFGKNASFVGVGTDTMDKVRETGERTVCPFGKQSLQGGA